MASKYGRNSPWRNNLALPGSLPPIMEGQAASGFRSINLDEAVALALEHAPVKHVVIHHCKCGTVLRSTKRNGDLCDPCRRAAEEAKERRTLVREDTRTIPMIAKAPMQPTSAEFQKGLIEQIQGLMEQIRKLERQFCI